MNEEAQLHLKRLLNINMEVKILKNMKCLTKNHIFLSQFDLLTLELP